MGSTFKPWEAEGIDRDTWYRRKANADGWRRRERQKTNERRKEPLDASKSLQTQTCCKNITPMAKIQHPSE